MNTSFKVFDFISSATSATVLGKCSLGAEFWDIGNKDCILGLSWSTANGLLVDTPDCCFRNTISGFVIPWSVRWIPSVTVVHSHPETLEDGEIVLMLDASERYSRYTTCFAFQQAARYPEHKPWDHEIPLPDPQAPISTGAVY